MRQRFQIVTPLTFLARLPDSESQDAGNEGSVKGGKEGVFACKIQLFSILDVTLQRHA